MYDSDAQRQLLRSHYCRTEFRFLTTLEDISNRLLVIPKPARVSALRAELTTLNHNLPAEVCMPMWCGADHSHEEGGQTTVGHSLGTRKDKDPRSQPRGHHRVVRISPGDAVVLNSAEKAPYLLHVEILENDLDFDPAKRANRDLLKKIVVQEERKKRKREGILDTDYVPPRGFLEFGVDKSTVKTAVPRDESESEIAAESSQRLRPTPRRTGTTPGDLEEVDLVEQLFGAKFSVREKATDLSETLPVPLTPKNKQLDDVVWSRPKQDPPLSSIPALSSPAIPLVEHFSQQQSETFQQTTPVDDDDLTPFADSPAGDKRRIITLDDYSDRMRTAAVMLAQLNASVTPERQSSDGHGATGLRRIPGAGYLMGNGVAPSMEQSGTGTSASNKIKLQVAQATAIRDRIMEEMMALEDERVERMTDKEEGAIVQPNGNDGKSVEDESIIRRELNKADPSAAVFKESWTAKKSRIQAASPWGHLAAWNVLSVIVKTGADLRQEQLATQLIERFGQIWKEEKSECWVRL